MTRLGFRGGATSLTKKKYRLFHRSEGAHLIHFFLLIPNMGAKNHRMHLNPLYDRKTGLSQPTQFGKKI